MSDWSNETPLNARTRLALRVLILMFSIIAPYQFEHRFAPEIEALKKMLDETAGEVKSEKAAGEVDL